MEFQRFAVSINRLDHEAAQEIRRRFFHERLGIDLTRSSPPDGLTLIESPDGMRYRGYLWEYFDDPEMISEAEFRQRIFRHDEVLAMWDLKSTVGLIDPLAYRRFPIDSVLRAEPETLVKGLLFLPEDLYVFNSSCAWAGALTHEWVEGDRYCLWTGDK